MTILLDGLCDHLRDVLWEDVFRQDASHAVNEFCVWVSVGIDMQIDRGREGGREVGMDGWIDGSMDGSMD